MPEEPLDPLVPEEPLEPLVPEEPLDPLVPELPLVPLDPDEPDGPCTPSILLIKILLPGKLFTFISCEEESLCQTYTSK